MADFASADVPAILQGLGWTPRAIGDRTWRCTVSTHSGDARIVVRHAGTWIYLAVIPFLDPEVIQPWGMGKYPPRFLGRILAVNNNLVLVKFALDEEGDLSLRVELPTESLQRREVETAAQTLLRTTEQYRGPIRDALMDAQRMSTNPPPTTPTLDLAEAAAASVAATMSAPPDEPSQPPALPSTPPELPVTQANPLSEPPVLMLSDSIPSPMNESEPPKPPPSSPPLAD